VKKLIPATLTMACILVSSAQPALAQMTPLPVTSTASKPASAAAPETGTAAASSQEAVSRAAPTPIKVEATRGAYRINAGDQLEVYVWGEERLQRTVKVLPDGTIAFPLVGQITVSGQLPRDVETLISERLQPQYRGQVPQVTVSVVAPLGLQFSVMGKVKTPGTFSPGRYVNLLEALSLAGGPITFANLDNILIYRKGTGDALSIVRVKLGAYLKAGAEIRSVSPDEIPAVNSGDTVVVP